jgi:LemA protein
MTTVAMIGFVVLAVIIFVAVWFIAGYNNLVRLKTYLKEAWSGIDVQLKRRYDLVPNLVETVKGYSLHEKSTLENIAKFRSAAMHATTMEARAGAEAGLTQALKTLFAVAENYPQLKANENFMRLQKELSVLEHELQLARRYYNGTARNYNMSVQMFPSRIIASVTGFTAEQYFELTSTAEREAPTVKF